MSFAPAAARDLPHLPKNVDPLAFTPLGYPDDDLKPKARGPLDELVMRERWKAR
jgi:hypothetical protein